MCASRDVGLIEELISSGRRRRPFKTFIAVGFVRANVRRVAQVAAIIWGSAMAYRIIYSETPIVPAAPAEEFPQEH